MRTKIGYTVRKEEWGKGYATEMARALVDYSCDRMGLDEIYGTVNEGFDDSINVLKKAGMTFFRYEFDKRGRYLVYVLKHE